MDEREKIGCIQIGGPTGPIAQGPIRPATCDCGAQGGGDCDCGHIAQVDLGDRIVIGRRIPQMRDGHRSPAGLPMTGTPLFTDDAPIGTVLWALRDVAAGHAPDARCVGRIRAADIIRALDAVLFPAPVTEPESDR